MVNDNKSLVREQFRFGAWNIRTMSGREVELVEEMKKYWLEMLGVSEAKVRGNGEKVIGDVRWRKRNQPFECCWQSVCQGAE